MKFFTFLVSCCFLFSCQNRNFDFIKSNANTQQQIENKSESQKLTVMINLKSLTILWDKDSAFLKQSDRGKVLTKIQDGGLPFPYVMTPNSLSAQTKGSSNKVFYYLPGADLFLKEVTQNQNSELKGILIHYEDGSDSDVNSYYRTITPLWSNWAPPQLERLLPRPDKTPYQVYVDYLFRNLKLSLEEVVFLDPSTLYAQNFRSELEKKTIKFNMINNTRVHNALSKLDAKFDNSDLDEETYLTAVFGLNWIYILRGFLGELQNSLERKHSVASDIDFFDLNISNKLNYNPNPFKGLFSDSSPILGYLESGFEKLSMQPGIVSTALMPRLFMPSAKLSPRLHARFKDIEDKIFKKVKDKNNNKK